MLFDAHDDIAVLRVDGLHGAPLSMATSTPSGLAAAILGYPLDGAFDAEPGRLGQTEKVSTDDAYGRGPVVRTITSLRGRVRPGNSGGPMVDAAGHVVATVFAAITGTGSAGGFAVPNTIVRARVDAARVHGRVSTGPCSA